LGPTLELQAAGRHESHSDFGSADIPKLAALFRLPKNAIGDIAFRTSWSKSFKAPDLAQLYSTQTLGITTTLLQDPLRPQDPPAQIRTVTGGNPSLLPEHAITSYAGTVFEPAALKGFSLTVDYLNLRIDRAINTPTAAFLLSATGRAEFPNAIVRDNSAGFPGPIQYISTLPLNQAAQYYHGFDFGAVYRLSAASRPLGRSAAGIPNCP